VSAAKVSWVVEFLFDSSRLSWHGEFRQAIGMCPDMLIRWEAVATEFADIDRHNSNVSSECIGPLLVCVRIGMLLSEVWFSSVYADSQCMNTRPGPGRTFGGLI
jgi:hypothetical protein